MARKKELTISEEMELNWNDGRYTDGDESFLMREFEDGWKDLTGIFISNGHNRLMFDPMRLVV